MTPRPSCRSASPTCSSRRSGSGSCSSSATCVLMTWMYDEKLWLLPSAHAHCRLDSLEQIVESIHTTSSSASQSCTCPSEPSSPQQQQQQQLLAHHQHHLGQASNGTQEEAGARAQGSPWPTQQQPGHGYRRRAQRWQELALQLALAMRSVSSRLRARLSSCADMQAPLQISARLPTFPSAPQVLLLVSIPLS